MSSELADLKGRMSVATTSLAIISDRLGLAPQGSPFIENTRDAVLAKISAMRLRSMEDLGRIAELETVAREAIEGWRRNHQCEVDYSEEEMARIDRLSEALSGESVAVFLSSGSALGSRLVSVEKSTEAELLGRIPPGVTRHISCEIASGTYSRVRLVVLDGSSAFRIDLASVGRQFLYGCGVDGVSRLGACFLRSVRPPWVVLVSPLVPGISIRLTVTNAGTEPAVFSALLEVG